MKVGIQTPHLMFFSMLIPTKQNTGFPIKAIVTVVTFSVLVSGSPVDYKFSVESLPELRFPN
jgi:hypothetical protein